MDSNLHEIKKLQTIIDYRKNNNYVLNKNKYKKNTC